ncbi:TetR/AcrR family transcriptional regulator [Streptomyces glaucescens]|uniref:Putative TetR family transcriptional regulator n=1 Tax=Streptomyces glaucescens TaxID=1907 RepID=A0A089X1Q6_STRGA|nr:TetR/AcrR family transcriptional regulator [Streptomyces glaucescens]AIR96958.1 putative TetR family transcriptional regulator [Streptomyces glaucescens]
MQSPDRRSGKVGRPPRLSRDAILTAAQRILDEEGAERLSMRRLAKELSSTPMALYHHVQDKDELLMLLLEAHARSFPRPRFPEQPRERLFAGAQVLHDILADCPWVVEVLASDKFVSLSAMWIVENMIDALIACGLSPDDAVYAYRVIWYYTVGELTVRFNRERTRDAKAPPYRQRVMSSVTESDFPRLAVIGPRWVELTSVDHHRRGLEAVIDGLLAQNV